VCQATPQSRVEDGQTLPVLVWRFATPVRAIASGPLGGGIGLRRWAMNATVPHTYARVDPDRHLEEIAAGLGLEGPGLGMLTAVDVTHHATVSDDGAVAVATVGLSYPTWAAADDGDLRFSGPGTINLGIWVPSALTDTALVNAVMTATEAKAQALWECGAQATGTASDAVFLACPPDGPGEPFGGPRSTWGARVARAVHGAVLTGARAWYGSPRG
jgi:adenosylcobinamide hydrolase